MKAPGKSKGQENILLTYVHVYSQEDTLEWILATTLPINTAQDALQVCGIYEKRGLIEEYHKCLKMGCKIEQSQLQTGSRIFVLLGLLSVVATQLLKLRDLSRKSSEKDLENQVRSVYREVLKRHYRVDKDLSASEFWRRVAMLGGFLARKSDGEPGWHTLWSGWKELQNMAHGFMLHSQTYG